MSEYPGEVRKTLEAELEKALRELNEGMMRIYEERFWGQRFTTYAELRAAFAAKYLEREKTNEGGVPE